MVNEPDLYKSLSQIQLFELFKAQLQKDFESSGCGTEFTADLPHEFMLLRDRIVSRLNYLGRTSPSLIPMLLYRIDVSEQQIKDYGIGHPELEMEQVISELIIKRILQKVILKKSFSG